MVDKVEFGQGTIADDGKVDLTLIPEEVIDPDPALSHVQRLLDEDVPARMAQTMESGPYTGGTPTPTIDWSGDQ